MDKIVRLETERLILRELRIEDAKEIFKNWTNDDEVSKYVTWDTHKSVEDTKNWLSEVEKVYGSNINYEWGIELKATGELIGSIGVYLKAEEDNRYEIGYGISRKYWRNGYTTEALKCVMDYLINQKDLKRFICRHAKDNPASGAVMQKVGFKYVKDGYFENADKTKHFETKDYYLDI